MFEHPRLARPHSWFAALATLAFLGAGSAAARNPGQSFQLNPGEQSTSVQMHIHGSLSEQNGSMEWHAQKAHDIGVDVIWWTDHDWRTYQLGYTPRYNFENCVWDAALHKWVEPDGFEQRWWETKYATTNSSVSVVDSLAYEGTKSFRLRVTGTASPNFAPLALAQTGSRKQQQYCVATYPRVHFALFPETFDPLNDKLVVQVTLSEHATSWPQLRYVLGSLDLENPSAIPLTCTPGQWNTYELDIANDAKTLMGVSGADSVRALDNSMFELMVELDTRNSHTALVYLDDLQYTSDTSIRGNALLNWSRMCGAYLETQVQDVHHLIGSEISYFKAQPHMNAYAPNLQLVDYTGHVYTDSLYYAVEQVRAQGGLVSYNHPWGIGIYGDFSETQEQKAARILAAKIGLLGTRLYDCDMLEVGYRVRHGINLAGHLSLWDCLTANEVFVTGTGVTDTHGSSWSIGWAPWQPSGLYENNYCSWVWSTAATEVPLLKGLAAGRVYFGDPYRWSADFDLMTTDGFPMGRVVLTDKSSHDVVVQVTGVPSNIEVRLKQGEIRANQGTSYTDVNWLRQETLTGNVVGDVFTDTVTVDTSLPTFVRFEVWNGTLEWAFSNPIHFLRQIPVEGIPARRLGASLDQVRIRSAEELVLKTAAFDVQVPQLSLTVDETTPGLGVLDIDVGPYGAPTVVTGATNWTFDTGILTLTGFAGTGSSVVVGWPPIVGSPVTAEPTIREVSLSTGRPNPFGRGLAAEFAMPSPGQALVEVMNVQGRRIRILQDEWMTAGRHRVQWDGRDAYGRDVADGVYFLRLRTLGTTLTTKAVKVH